MQMGCKGLTRCDTASNWLLLGGLQLLVNDRQALSAADIGCMLTGAIRMVAEKSCSVPLAHGTHCGGKPSTSTL